MDPALELTPFHANYYAILDAFARGVITRLMVSIPPQHGKSHAASRLLPAYLLGQDPDLRVALASYSFSLARKFGQGVRQVLESPIYKEIFPDTYLKGANGSSKSSPQLLTAEEFDCMGHRGGMKLVGRECSLTGNRVDVMILDDLYKDALEANSPVIRENTWEWYTSVVRTRMHNNSKELVVFTRWHQDDLIGRIAQHEAVVEIESLEQLSQIPRRAWAKINFEALKQTPSTPIDPRTPNQPLWGERHSAELLIERQKIDPTVFEALYQGNPISRAGLLYGEFATYRSLPTDPLERSCYVDTADTGSDFLCAICYERDSQGFIYITNVVYSDQPMEKTEIMVSQMIENQAVARAQFESNNGGRGFARSVEQILKSRGVKIQIETLHQSASKEARILSNSTAVIRKVRMPEDWKLRWERFAMDLTDFKLNFKANAHDDAPDTLTAIVEQVEQSIEKANSKKIKTLRFSNKKR